MKQHILSVLVENHSGVLSRVAGLFARRGFNIDSLTVGITQDPKISRMTIAVLADEYIIDQIKKQLHKLVEVIQIIELKNENAVVRELALVKVLADEKVRPVITGIVDIFRAKIIDVAPESLTVEITGAQSKVESFIELLAPYGIHEIVRTGITALERGNKKILDYQNTEEE